MYDIRPMETADLPDLCALLNHTIELGGTTAYEKMGGSWRGAGHSRINAPGTKAQAKPCFKAPWPPLAPQGIARSKQRSAPTMCRACGTIAVWASGITTS